MIGTLMTLTDTMLPFTDSHRFERLVSAIADYAIYMLDLDGIVVSWNRGAESISGHRAEEAIGRHFSYFFTEEDRAAGVPETYLALTRETGRHEADGWRIRKEGGQVRCNAILQTLLDDQGGLLGFVTITRDITDRAEVQERLRQSERRFRLLVDGVIDYALYMLSPEGTVTNWNSGAERLKGYRAEEIVGLHFSQFYTKADRAAGRPEQALEIAASTGRFEAEGWRVRKDGTLFWANVVIDAIRDETGEMVGFAKITRDITERREAQLALQEAQIQRAHTQKMEALGQLTGGVAHDFNNLLMVVSGHIFGIKNRVGEDPRLRRSVAAIEMAAERGGALTRQLLSFSRRQTFTPTVVDLAELIKTVGTMLEGAIEARIEIDVTLDSDTWPIKVDAGELELALVNIVLNARDAMPKGGRITLEAANVYLSARDTASGIEGEFVALRLTDTGTGIAPDMLAKVFDPFFTTKPVGKGTGLGLSQVYGFTHQSGGTVTIDSLLGNGTTVTLYLPRAEQAAGGAAKEKDTPISHGGGKVLVVEDNPDVAEVSAFMLEQAGYVTRRVADAEMALLALENDHFDLVISDIVMPGRYDGLKLARLLRELQPDLPVLLVSGYAGEAGEASQEFTVLRKPFRFSQLSHAVARVMAGR